MADKTVISFNKPTPNWAKTIFWIEFALNKAVLGWLATTNLISPDNVKEIMGIALAIDTFTAAIAHMFGINKPDSQNQNS